MSSLDYTRNRRFANMIVGQYGMSVVESAEVKCPHTSASRVIYLPLFPTFGTRAEKDSWMFFLIHECWHHVHERDLTLIGEREINMNSMFGHALNILVDHNIEHCNGVEFEGALALCSAAYSHHYDTNLLDRLASMPPPLAALTALDIQARSEWCIPHDYNVVDKLTPQSREKYDLIASYLQEYTDMREPGEDNLNLCIKLFKAMGEEDEIENAEIGEPEAGEGSSGEGGKEGKGEADPSGEKGKGREKKERSASKRVKVKYNTLVMDDHGEKPSSDMDIDYSRRVAGEDMKQVPLKEMKSVSKSSKYNSTPLVYTLSTRVKNLLKTATQAKWQGGKSKGKINKRSLASICSGNERVFREKVDKHLLNASVLVLVDGSGSMSGERYRCATQAASMLADCMMKINVPCKVSTFSSNYETNIVLTHKEFDERVSGEIVYSRMGDVDNIFENNSDGEFLLWAADQLFQRKQKRKVMIVLSDGQPCATRVGDEVKFTEKVSKDLLSSPIEVYSIGIQSDSVKDFYKHYKVIDSPDQLESNLLNLIKQALIN